MRGREGLQALLPLEPGTGRVKNRAATLKYFHVDEGCASPGPLHAMLSTSRACGGLNSLFEGESTTSPAPPVPP